MLQRRTDLAMEAKELYEESAGKQAKIEGVEAKEENEDGIEITTVKVLNENGEKALGKPTGTYITLSFDTKTGIDESAMKKTAKILCREMKQLLKLSERASVLVAGLGNIAITPDAIGPRTVKNTVITRHLTDYMPEYFGSYRAVSAFETGVLGTTGIESAEIVKAVAAKTKPDCIIVIDALATRRLFRVCSTVQLSDTGIVPGSGVGNSRAAINKQTVGVPVIAVGVPTVVDVGTLCADIMEEAGFGQQEPEMLAQHGRGMIVTPRDIDAHVAVMARLLGIGINMAIHEGMEIEEMDWLLNKI